MTWRRPATAMVADRRSDVLVGALLTLIAALVCAAAILRRPDINASLSFAFSDPGVNLLLVDRMAEGARLYRDVGYNYGPLAIWPYRIFSSVFGNTPQTYMAFLGLFSVLNVVLAYALLRTRISKRSATIVVVAGLYATILIPGSLVFGVHSSPYFVLERTLFLLILFAWQAPDGRGRASAALVGALLGVGQGIRFGTALFLGAAIVVTDLLALYITAADRGTVTRWIRRSLVTLAAFLAVEICWAIYALITLPTPDAVDFLWPAYILEAFDAWRGNSRWPHLGNARFFIGQQLIVFASAAFALAGLIVIVHGRQSLNDDSGRRHPVSAEDFRLLVPLVFYALGAAGLFRWEYHFHQYAWTLVIATGLVIDRAGSAIGGAFLILGLPGLLLLLRANLVTRPPPDVAILPTSGGGYVVADSAGARRIRILRAYAADTGGRSLVIMRNGAGFHALFDIPFNGRQVFYLFGFARAGDEERTLRALDSNRSAVVLADYQGIVSPSRDPCEWYGWPHFRRTFCNEIARRVDWDAVIRVDDATWILPIVRLP